MPPTAFSSIITAIALEVSSNRGGDTPRAFRSMIAHPNPVSTEPDRWQVTYDRVVGTLASTAIVAVARRRNGEE